MPTDYRPIACGFHDELGLRMLRGASCTLVIDAADGSETLDTTIEDLFTEGDEEFIRTSEGRRIRLDRIRSVDDVERPGAC